MIFLVFSIICGGAMSLLFKLAQTKGWSEETITLVNYVVCCLLCLPMAAANGSLALAAATDKHRIAADLSAAFAGTPNAGGSFWLALIFGVLLGIFFLVKFLNMQACIRQSGASMTTMFSYLSFVIPLVAAIFLWDEIPGVWQWIGIGGTLAAILVVSAGKGGFTVNFLLLGQQLLASGASLLIKAFSVYALADFKQLFYLFTFASALIIYLAYVIIRHVRKKTPFDFSLAPILGGAFLGTMNTFSNLFTQNALRAMPTNVFYPINSAGALICVALVAMLAFKEKISRNQKIAMLISLVSIVVVNL